MAVENSIIMSLPLEIRQNIYEWASERPTGSRLILKEFFEKIDSDIPRLPPIVVAPTNNTLVATSGDSGMDGVEDDGSEDQDNGAQPAASTETQGDQTGSTGVIISQDDMIQPQVPTTVPAGYDDIGSAGADAGSDGEVDVDEDADEEEQEDEEDEEQEEDENDEEDDDVANFGNAPLPTSILHSYGRNTKYRHLLPIMQLSHCPPPNGLLATCKQINNEATSFHRKRTVLTIDVNKGFEHFSFFYETMSKLIDTSYSPLEQIHKVNLIITWDSEWLREKSTPPDNQLQDGQMFYFDYYFRERIQVMINLLQACPELEKVTIDYHDTEDTHKSRDFMFNQLMDLQVAIVSKNWVDAQGNELPVEVELHEHLSAAGTPHARNSLLALRRTEFDHFLSSGLTMR